MSRTCAPYFLQYRLSVSLQRKIEFILNKVKLGQHERHLEWLRKQVRVCVFFSIAYLA